MSEDQPPLRRIFNEAVEIADARQRAAFLVEACGADTALLRRIEELIQANRDAGPFLGGAGETIANAATKVPKAPAPGKKPDAGIIRYFGDYQLLEEIARGGMGVVFKARQTSLNRTVALKMILAGRLASPALVQRFHTEAEAAANLTHPNIVTIHEVGEHGGQHYFSMDYIEGQNLGERMRQGLMPLKEAAGCVRTIAGAIHHAHQRGVLHRDLKPSNILLNRQGQPHVTDFGLAKLVEQGSNLTPSEDVMGTPSYMAPEQAAGDMKRLTTAADIYSLGAILYELLTGRPPFRAATAMQTLRQVMEQEPEPPSLVRGHQRKGAQKSKAESAQSLLTSAATETLDRDLETICLKCLRKDPFARYNSAEALAEDLARWLRHEPIQARPATAALRLRRWTRRNRAVTVLIFSLCAGLAGALLLLQMVSREKRAKVVALADAERQGKELRVQLYKRLDELELHNNRGYPEVITSEDRFIVTGGHAPVLRAGMTERRYTVGIYARQSPTVMMNQFAPILTHLESTLASSVSEVVRLDLAIYGTYELGIRALLMGEVDFMRLGPSSYVIAKKKNPEIKLVAVQTYRSVFRGAIFVRLESGITNLPGLAGRGPFAFGDKESTSGNYLSKKALLDAGLTGASLVGCCTNLKSHSAVLDAVLEGRFMAGAGNASAIERKNGELQKNGQAGLRVLKKFEEPGTPWVARQGMSPGVVARLRAELLSLTDTRILNAFADEVTGFEPGSPHDYDELEGNMKQAEIFESR